MEEEEENETKRSSSRAAGFVLSSDFSFLGDKINDNDDEGGGRLPQLSWPNLWTYKERRARRRRRWRRSGGYKTSPLRYSPLRAPSLVRTCSARKADDPLTFFETPVRLAAAAWARLPISVHILAPDKVDPKLYGELGCPL